jgi:hypothetical protein
VSAQVFTTSDAATTYDGGALIHLVAEAGFPPGAIDPTQPQPGIAGLHYKIDAGAVVTVTPTAGPTGAPGIETYTVPPSGHGGVECATCHPIRSSMPAIPASAVIPADHYSQNPAVACTDCHPIGGGIDGAPAQLSFTVAASADGTHTLTFWSTDASGNVEISQAVSWLSRPLRTSARLSKHPAGPAFSVVRHRGLAYFSCSATLETTGGTLVSGKYVRLQKSADGVKWVDVRGTYKMSDVHGGIAAMLAFKSAGVGRYRWFFWGDDMGPVGDFFERTMSSETRITVR